MSQKNQMHELPFQNLLERDLFQVYPISGFENELSETAHRHNFYMLLWSTAGAGEHLIDFEPYTIRTNQVYFLRPGQVHQVKTFVEDGWLLVFEDTLLNTFTRRGTLEEQFAMFDYFNQHPYVQLNEEVEEVYTSLFRFLNKESRKEQANLAVVPYYVYLLLLHAHQLHLQQHTQQQLPNHDLERLRDLRILIERKYKEEHEMGYYVQKLGLSAKKLNEVTRHALGKTVHQMLQERLLTESKYLLLASPLSVKEIAYELGFNDPAYFGRFFKKHTQLSPASYKESRSK
ncbi:MAG: helix-turn-helix domain-containing protein [Hymenobacteraceae bacterium]|nr:helix-turn-helix domain-containing protein [Hymenobacteraceae bacterium]